MLCLVRPRACQRCGGDLSIECDIYGTYIYCIQCGANWNGKDLISAHARATEAKPAETPVAASQKR